MRTHARAHESVLAYTRLGKQVLPLLPALDEDTRRVQRLAVLAALRENKTQEAIRIFGDFFARHAGDAARQQGDGNAGRPQDEVNDSLRPRCRPAGPLQPTASAASTLQLSSRCEPFGKINADSDLRRASSALRV